MAGFSSRELEQLSRVRRLTASGEARELRRAARLTQTELAAAVGVKPSTISRWETGERQPRGSAAARYAQVLDVIGRAA